MELHVKDATKEPPKQPDVRVVRVWADCGKVHRYDTRSGELVITFLPWRTRFHRVWQWLTTPWRYYQLWKYGE